MNRLVIAVLGVTLALAGIARAQDQNVAKGQQQESGQQPPPSQEPEKPWSLEASLTVPTAYMFRGYVVNDSDVQLQPDVRGETTINVGELALKPHLEAWGNLVPSSDTVSFFNELDLIGGVAFELPGKFTLDVEYILYNSPADDFDDIHEIGLLLNHDDFLQPHFAIYREVKNSLSTIEQGTYFEVGIEPELPWKPTEKLTFTLPALLGMGGDHYYTASDGRNQLFGYASAGLHASYAITDSFSIEAGVAYWQLLSDSVEASNHGVDYKVVADIGVAWSF